MSTSDCIGPLLRAGIEYEDALALRRIAMTLHRWHELECGDSNGSTTWCLVRGRKERTGFVHDDAGAPFIAQQGTHAAAPHYMAVSDREAGARKRLAAIMERYPRFAAYIQGDPRGAALYILRPGDVPQGEDARAYYSRGLAVYK